MGAECTSPSVSDSGGVHTGRVVPAVETADLLSKLLHIRLAQLGLNRSLHAAGLALHSRKAFRRVASGPLCVSRTHGSHSGVPVRRCRAAARCIWSSSVESRAVRG
eukprot:scaffold4044_cov399-Prasinococcus_capsulatus_cf.AAC.15